MENIRRPVVAGYFYPARRKDLVDMIEWSFKHRHGPGELPSPIAEKKRGVIGYVVPHAGYMYSGPVAAHSYLDMSRHGLFETIVILGTNHTGLGKPVSVYPSGVWETPLGSLRVDGELGKAIVENSEIADFDIYAHIEEHSIEVQLPFIQYIYNGNVKILPIVIGIHTPEAAEDLSNAILKAVKETGREIVVLASSDFNHYEPHDVTLDKDIRAIEKITALDTRGFYDVMIENDISICGPGGIMTLIEITRKQQGKVSLLKHATSGDISGDKRSVVGYASIKFHL